MQALTHRIHSVARGFTCRDTLFRLDDETYLLRFTSTYPKRPPCEQRLTAAQAGAWLNDAPEQLISATPRLVK